MYGSNKAINGCCKDCKKRYPGCHDHCEKYQAAKKEWETFKESRKLGVYELYKIKAIQKEKRRSRNYD